MQNDQQAYDRGSTIFSPDGRLYQVEYAREAVTQGSPAVGVRTADGVALAAHRSVRSSLMEPRSIEKLHRVDDDLGIASAGHVADARRLVDFARRRAQTDRLRYGEPIDTEALTKAVTDHVQEYTQTGGKRPFGTALLVGGVDGDRPRLFETDPSGTPTEWQATAIGRDADEVRSYLEEAYESDLGLDTGVDLAVEAIADATGESIAPDSLGLAAIGEDGFEAYDENARRAVIDRVGRDDGAAS